jgi:hypothetical protein
LSRAYCTNKSLDRFKNLIDPLDLNRLYRYDFPSIEEKYNGLRARIINDPGSGSIGATTAASACPPEASGRPDDGKIKRAKQDFEGLVEHVTTPEKAEKLFKLCRDVKMKLYYLKLWARAVSNTREGDEADARGTYLNKAIDPHSGFNTSSADSKLPTKAQEVLKRSATTRSKIESDLGKLTSYENEKNTQCLDDNFAALQVRDDSELEARYKAVDQLNTKIDDIGKQDQYEYEVLFSGEKKGTTVSYDSWKSFFEARKAMDCAPQTGELFLKFV